MRPRQRVEPLPEAFEAPLALFLTYMRRERQLADNTLDAYQRDLRRYLGILAAQGLAAPDEVRPNHVAGLLRQLREAGLSAATVARNLTSVKRFHHFLLVQGVAQADPAEYLDAPRLERRLPDLLSVAEVERILAASDVSEPLGLRDRAILELLYASGLRVSELVDLEIAHVSLDSALVRIRGPRARERMVPIGQQAVMQVANYLHTVRPVLAQPDSGQALFLNARGGRLSRMTIWKLIRTAADRARLEREVNPHMLRHSFAAHMLERGASLRIVQELLGHADMATTQVYARLDSQDLREVHRTYHPRG